MKPTKERHKMEQIAFIVDHFELCQKAFNRPDTRSRDAMKLKSRLWHLSIEKKVFFSFFKRGASKMMHHIFVEIDSERKRDATTKLVQQ